MDDLVDVVPFVILAVLLGVVVRFANSGDRRAVRPAPGLRERLRVLVVSVGVVLLAPTVGYGIGTALSMSQTADSRLAVAAACAALVGVVLWRKLRLRRRIG